MDKDVFHKKSQFIFNHPLSPPSYTDTFPDLKESSESEQSKLKPHPLDSTPSHLLLKTILDPLLKLAKYCGVFPVQLNENGLAEPCRIRSLPTLYYLIWVLLFISLSSFYSPLYLELLHSATKDSTQSINTIARYLFVTGQFLTAAATLFLIPRLGIRTSELYNGLQAVSKTIYDRGSCGSAFHRSVYWKTRAAVGFWTLIVMSSWYLWWKSFHFYFREKFMGNSSSSLTYYSAVGGAIGLATLIACHVLPSFIFLGVVGVIRASYQCIYKDQRLPTGGIKFTSDIERLNLYLEMFKKLNALVNRVGEIFGRYLIVEMWSFFTSVLTNSFTVLTGFDKRGVQYETTIVSISINCLWFWALCEGGEAVIREQQRCIKTLKYLIMEHSSSGTGHSKGTLLMITLVDEQVRGVTAASYFSIKRTLATQVIGTLVTYLIVMLQFKITDDKET